MADENTNVIGVKMLVVSGRTEDSQFFDYRPSFYGDIIRVEWDLDTMNATIDATAAEYLIKHGYAIRTTPEPEPAPIVIEAEPLIVETIDNSSSAPSASEPPPAAVPTEATPAPPQSPTPSQTPPAAATSTTSSSGGKRKKQERSK